MAKKPMTKGEIVDHFAEKFGVTKKLAGQIIDEYAALVYKEAKNDFTLPGIGKMVVVKREAREGRNPSTGQKIKIPAKQVLKFRVAKACSDAVLK
ncbi:MAG: HU family DNA-binding protein [Ignavibacteria bacterium]|nr:HU family DNA-binding protein [Ignavibacteria bacterium]